MRDSDWEATMVVMLLISIAVFTLQRALGIMDPIFEVCIFHLPALLSLLLYLRERLSRGETPF